MIDALFLAVALFTPNIFNMDIVQGSEELKLSIRTEKSVYVSGETVYLEVSLRNTGSKTIKAPKFFMLPADDPNKNNLDIRVYDAAGHRLSRISHTLTGRSEYYPEIRPIKPGEIYRDSIKLAGTFAQGHGRKKIKNALWSLGENPELSAANEYPFIAQGTFKVQVIYHVGKEHLMGLREAEVSTVWKGELISNTIEIVLT